MPTIFISYKRGTAGINPLRERFEAAKYRTWYDQDDIHIGDDWQKSIDQGIDHSDALIVGLTPGTCDSPYVLYEVERAQRQNKLIFPIKLEALNEAVDLPKLNLSKTQFVDFTKAEPDAWNKAFARLLADMQRHEHLQITRHTERAQRGTAAHELHQRYLRTHIIEPLGRLQLSQIEPTGSDGVPLEAVYVDSPTGLALSVEVQDWRVVDWWIDQRSANNPFGARSGEDDKTELPRQRPEALGYERAALDALIPQIDHAIDEYREQWPNEKPEDDVNSWKNGAHRSVLTLQVQDIAAARDRFVVLGAPGSGKSTFVRHLALCLAGAQTDGWTRPAGLAQLGAWPHKALTPVYIELRRFVASNHFPAGINEQPTADHLWNYVKTAVLGDDLAGYADDLKFDLENGHAVLILDGLDEVPYPEGELPKRQKQLRSLAQALNDRYKDSRIIVASRPHAYEGWTLPGFQAIMIAAFEDSHRVELGKRLYRAAGLADEEAANKAQALNTALQPVDAELKDRPLFVTLMATIFLENEGGGLPTRRGALYRRSILLLLERWTTAKPGSRSLPDMIGSKTADNLISRLGALAFEIHDQAASPQDTPEIEWEKIAKHLKLLTRDKLGTLIQYLSENAGVLVSPGQNAERDVFRFAHRSFQEYLAGVQILANCDTAKSFEPLRTIIQAKPATWREPALLLSDALIDADRAGDLWDLIDDLLDDEVPEQIAAEDARWWGVWLAARLIEDHQPQLGKMGRGERAIRDSLIDWLVNLLETPGALPPVERAACGRALGLLGDPRDGVAKLNAEGVPMIEWCPVPAGSYHLGSDEDSDNPKHVTDLTAFQIAKHPITYGQFQAFIDAEDGYRREQWWDGLHEDGLEQQRSGADEQAFKFWNHPRENVSWYDAMAFCHWLSAKLGYEVRLPTDDEWEAAARGTDERRYPYPGDYDPAKGNTNDTGIQHTSAVGLFPDGASPYGALDMSGNVWEWTLTEYRSRDSSNLTNNESRTLRGGSWFYLQDFARAAFRFGSSPGFRLNFGGFRVVVVGRPPSQ